MDSVINKPLVSIITPTYNSISYIEAAYESILSQSYEQWEWVITDDCSYDDTFQYIKELSHKDSRVRPLQLSKNSGAAVARNSCIDSAKGEYIAFLDSDDYWEKDKLRLQIDFMQRNSIEFSFTAYSCGKLNDVNSQKVIDCTHENIKFTYHDMLKKKATLGCSTVIVTRNLIANDRMPLIRTGQDYAFWLKLLKKTDAYLLKQCLTHYRIIPGSLSRNKFKKAKRQWQIYRNLEKISILRSAYYFTFYAFRAIFR